MINLQKTGAVIVMSCLMFAGQEYIQLHGTEYKSQTSTRGRLQSE